MCSMCGCKTYGQDQPEERAKDVKRLEEQLKAAEKRSKITRRI